MVNRENFERQLKEVLQENSKKKKFLTSMNKLLLNNHSMTPGDSNKYLCGIQDLANATVEELYWIAQSVSLVLENISFNEYFTSHEMIAFDKSKRKLETSEDMFPIVFENVLQVANDQWLTIVDTNFLYDLYKKQLINYNKNTQRPSIKREKDGIVEYKIAVNKASVKAIADLMKQNLFIPNGITLNLNVDNTETEFEYKNGTLTLFSGNMDIVDGFHRYQALMKNKLEDPNFNYTMQLNIMNFDESKATTFIAQEDKRNKINKSVVKAMDATDPINMVIQRLNDDSRCYLFGQIGRSETDKISSVVLYDILKNNFKIKTRQEVVGIVKYLKEVINVVIEDNLFAYDFLTLSVVFTAASLYYEKENYITNIETIINQKGKLSADKFLKGKLTKVLIDEIKDLQGE